MTDHSRKYSHVWDFSLFISLKKLFISLSTHQFIQDMAILFKFIGHSVSIPKLAMLDHQMMKKNFHRLRHVRLDSWTILSMKIFSQFFFSVPSLFSRKNNKDFSTASFLKLESQETKNEDKVSRFPVSYSSSHKLQNIQQIQEFWIDWCWSLQHKIFRSSKVLKKCLERFLDCCCIEFTCNFWGSGSWTWKRPTWCLDSICRWFNDFLSHVLVFLSNFDHVVQFYTLSISSKSSNLTI